MASTRRKRPHGTGSLFERYGSWYGQWLVRGKPVSRVIGPVRKPSSREGLTRSMAEARLRELMSETAKAPPPVTERLTVEQVGLRLIKHLRAKGRKHSTLESYESYIRVHLEPFFGDTPISEITCDDVEDFIEACITDRHQSIKSTRNYLGFLHSLLDFAIRKRWTHENPCRLVDKPDPDEDANDIRFLDQTELEELIHPANGPSRHHRATLERAARVRSLRDHDEMPWKKIAKEVGVAESTAIYLYRCRPEAISTADEALWRVDRTMYLTAAMTGLRQGELLALRWIDVDWLAHKIRVRRNYVRGQFGTPKSKRSSRSVPMADPVASELEQLFQAAAFQADDDLVFCHPHTSQPLERGQLLKRFKKALERAGVREVRFHDLRHTFGTRMAAAGVPMRTLQEWLGHRDYKTTLIYADYAPAPNEVELVNAAFSAGDQAAARIHNSSIILRATEITSNQETPGNTRVDK